MEPKFKVGDKIVLLENKSFGTSTKRGDIGTIQEVCDYYDDAGNRYNSYLIKMSSGRSYYFRDNHFKLLKKRTKYIYRYMNIYLNGPGDTLFKTEEAAQSFDKLLVIKTVKVKVSLI